MTHRADPDFESLGSFRVARSVRDEFRNGGWERWYWAYPALFDDLDAANARSQANNPKRHGGGHFAEWIGAVILYRVGGYLSIQSKYDRRSHERKREIFARLAGPAVHTWISEIRETQRAERNRARESPAVHVRADKVFEPGFPDLLVYRPYDTEWFFVDTKGPGDRIQPYQRPWFKTVSEFTGHPVRLLCIDWLSERDSQVGRSDPPGLRVEQGPPWDVVVRSFAETLPR